MSKRSRSLHLIIVGALLALFPFESDAARDGILLLSPPKPVRLQEQKAQEALGPILRIALSKVAEFEVVDYDPELPILREAMIDGLLDEVVVEDPHDVLNASSLCKILDVRAVLWIKVLRAGRIGKHKRSPIIAEATWVNVRGDPDNIVVDLTRDPATQSELKFARKVERNKEKRRTAVIASRVAEALRKSVRSLGPIVENVSFDDVRKAVAAGQLEEAVRLGQSLVAADTASLSLPLELGGLYEQAGELRHAVREYRRAIRLAPNGLQPRKRLAEVCLKIADDVDGQERYAYSNEAYLATRVMTEIDGTEEKHHFLRAQAAEKLIGNLPSYRVLDREGLVVEARDHYIKAVSLASDNFAYLDKAAHFMVANWTNITSEHRGQAIDWRKRLVDQSPEDIKNRQLYIQALVKDKQYRKAYDHLEILMNFVTDNVIGVHFLTFAQAVSLLDRRWETLYRSTGEALISFDSGVISPEDFLVRLETISASTDRLLVLVRSIESPSTQVLLHRQRLLSFEYFDQAIYFELQFAQSGDTLHHDRAVFWFEESVRALAKTRLSPSRRAG